MRSFLLFLGSLFLLASVARAEPGEYVIAQIDPAGSAFTGKINGQFRTFRVRTDVEVTINGLRATFGELETGMKARVTTADATSVTRIVATGLRKRQPPVAAQPAAPILGAQQPRDLKATISANSPDAFPIGDVRKGTTISLQYLRGKWKAWGRLATAEPDEEKTEGGDLCRLVIALPSQNGKGGEVLAVVPPNTKAHSFLFEAQSDYAGLVLRINGKDNTFAANPGSVEYRVRIQPPVK